jgi:hypothetical protein
MPPAIENGWYVLADPKHRSRKHTKANAVRVKTEQEAIDLLRKGFSIRIEDPVRSTLIRKNLYIDGVLLA